MAKKKQKEVTDINEAAEILGHSQMETPDGGVVTTEEPEMKEPPQTQETVEETPDTSEQQQLELEAEQEVSSTQKEDGTLTEEEQQRRSWQAEADRAKAEKEKLQSELEQQKQATQQLQNVVASFLQKVDGTPASQSPQQEQPTGPPSADYIVDGYFDQQKHEEWQRKHDEWLLSQAENRVTKRWSEKTEKEKLTEQLQLVAEEFPEYRNPLTGEIDVARVQRDLQNYTSKKTVVDLLREAKGKTPAKKTNVDPLSTEASLAAIEKNANKPQSAATTVESSPEKKVVPKKIIELRNTFGDIDLPEDFDGFIE